MTREEIIADERYHTCGRCRWGDLNDDFYPCNKCNHSADKREDLWQYAEEVEECRDTANLLDLGVDCISRAQTQTEIEMNASRYTIAKECGGMGQVEWSDQLIKVSDAVDIIRHLPSVTPQEPRWIPVSEKLPEKDGEYLLWGKICEDEENNYCFIGEYDSCAEEFGYWSDHYDSSTLGFLDSEHIEYHKVLAWMPLPAPYEPQESEEV